MERTRRRSNAWNYFTKLSEDTVKCQLCSAELRYTNSTGAMLNHLKLKHPSASCEKEDKSQPPPTAFAPGSSRKCTAQRAEKITELLCSMITTDMLPISVVEGTGFRALMSFLEPDYCVPVRQIVTWRLEMSYEERAKSLREQLENAVKVALITDCWTALTTESYMTVTCHYIENWKLRSAVLQTESVAEQHTAENLAEKLHLAVERWGLAGRVLACVHDKASDIVATSAPRCVPWESVKCFAHTLQLAINEGFSSSEVDYVVAAAGRLVAHFHHSAVAAKALERKQTKLQVKPHRLIQWCKTSWNSIYDMFERLSEQRWAVTAVLSDSSVTKQSDAQTLQLQDQHWQLIEDILPLLSTLKCAATAMSAEQSISIANIYPICNSLLQTHLQSGAPGENPKVADFKAAVRRALEQQMKPNDPAIGEKPALIASLLDPRHKHMRFLLPVVQMAAKSKLLQLALIEEPPSAVADADPMPSASSAELKEPKIEPELKKMRVAERSAIVRLLGEDYTEKETEENAVENELENYYREPCPSLECNPLEWWEVNAQRFPRLGKLAKSYLCIPGSSVPTEHVFSNTGLTVNRLHSARLTPEHAGSSGKGTALKGVSDVDLVVFVKSIKDFQDLKAKRKNIIAEIRTELEQCNLEDDLTLHIKETKWDNPRVLTLTLISETMGKHIDFDVLPAFDALGQMRSGYKPVPEMYVRLIESSPEGNEFSCCFTELQRNFIISLPTKLKSLIRLVKHWYKEYILPRKKELRKGESLPPQYALELLSVYAWEHGGRDPAFNMARGFRTVLGLIQRYKQLCIYWTINYDFEDETLRWYLNRQLRKSRPIILDPADPTGIVGHGSCWDLVAEEAERCCDQLCCRKRDGFAVQPWDVPLQQTQIIAEGGGVVLQSWTTDEEYPITENKMFAQDAKQESYCTLL